MSARIEELDWAPTSAGDISLRRRRDPLLGVDVFEVRLGEDFLMSSLFTVAEIELATLGLQASGRDRVDVVVGGLGLGYTALAALADRRVRTVVVIEALRPVISWHERGLVPGGAGLVADARTRLVHDDFFAMAASVEGFDPARPGRRFDVVLLDIDHSPRHVLHPSHASFYCEAGLRSLSLHLNDDGVFALWSDDPPDGELLEHLAAVFTTSAFHVVSFANPLTGGTSQNTVYVAQR
jgi:spermidine synthase